MKFQIALVLGIVSLAYFVKADLYADTHKLIDMVMSDEAEHIESECFSQIKDELIKELEVAAAEYVYGVENGMPVFKPGLYLNMNNFIENTLLPKALVSASEDCVHSVKDELRAFLKAKFGAAFKTIDPDF
ncbi:uncharacterized protein [Musca autumnalis]|uniref:uncharacterized protein n=1 Tax=Musca autumnalis TaxID=221902 RepID=UPI003CECE0EF